MDSVLIWLRLAPALTIAFIIFIILWVCLLAALPLFAYYHFTNKK